MTFDWYAIDWDIVSSLAATAATILAIIGIGLAWKATSISRQSTDVDRRTYLDGILDNLMVRMDEFEAASQPYWEHIPTPDELKSSDLRSGVSRSDYRVLHRCVLHVRSAINRVGASGLCELDKAEPDTLDLAEALTLLEATFWASYHFSLGHSKREAESMLSNPDNGLSQTWEGAWEEVGAVLQSERGFASDSTELTLARQWANQYPTSEPVGRAQLTDAVLTRAKRMVRERYRLVVSEQAPWHDSERRHAKKSLAPVAN